jgi:hypothetical protein
MTHPEDNESTVKLDMTALREAEKKKRTAQAPTADDSTSDTACHEKPQGVPKAE